EQIKAEREAAILDGAIETNFPVAVRQRWAGRLREMAEIFRLTRREEPAAIAAETAAALADPTRPATALPVVRALAARRGGVARAKRGDGSRAPARRARP